MYRLIVFSLLVVSFFSCKTEKEEGDGAIAISIAKSASMGSSVRASIPDGSVRSGSWEVRDVDGALLTCGQVALTYIVCSFDNPGAKTFYFKGILKDGATIALSASISIINTGDVDSNQGPQIDLRVTQSAKSGQVKSIGGVSMPEGGFDIGAISFDLSNSTDDNSTIASYFISIKNPSGAISTFNSAQFDHSFASPGYYYATVKLTDVAGKITAISFEVGISCPADWNLIDEEMDLAALQASISTATERNEYNHYSFDGNQIFSLSGSHVEDHGFLFKWDFDGDGKFDTDWVQGTGGVVEGYVMSRGYRLVRAKAKDRFCPNRVSEEVSFYYNFDNQRVRFEDGYLSAAPGVYDHTNGTGMIDTYYFLQGFIRASNATSYSVVQNEIDGVGLPAYNPPVTIPLLERDVQYIATQRMRAMEDSEQLKVKCDYAMLSDDGYLALNSSLVISGIFQYWPGHSQGLSLKVSGLIDDGVVVETDNAFIQLASYTSGYSPDSSGSVVYTGATGACTLKLEIIAREGVGQCLINPGEAVPIYKQFQFRDIKGVYSCNNLASTSSGSISIDRGEFFCQVLDVGPCGVGGGGGGGVSPVLQ